MFKDKTIKNALMEVLDSHIIEEQTFYENECKVIDEKLAEDIEVLTEKAEENKKLMVQTIVKKIVNKLLN